MLFDCDVELDTSHLIIRNISHRQFRHQTYTCYPNQDSHAGWLFIPGCSDNNVTDLISGSFLGCRSTSRRRCSSINLGLVLLLIDTPFDFEDCEVESGES